MCDNSFKVDKVPLRNQPVFRTYLIEIFGCLKFSKRNDLQAKLFLTWSHQAEIFFFKFSKKKVNVSKYF